MLFELWFKVFSLCRSFALGLKAEDAVSVNFDVFLYSTYNCKCCFKTLVMYYTCGITSESCYYICFELTFWMWNSRPCQASNTRSCNVGQECGVVDFVLICIISYIIELNTTLYFSMLCETTKTLHFEYSFDCLSLEHDCQGKVSCDETAFSVFISILCSVSCESRFKRIDQVRPHMLY